MTVTSSLRIIGSALCLVLASAPAWALYKVVGPNGEITYTDRPPADAKKAAPLGTVGGANMTTAGLPYSLQQVANKYPVSLYTTERCPACEQGKQFLMQRGIPFIERTVTTAADIAAYRALTGVEQLPALQIGSQQLLGFTEASWSSYLTAAGYPEKTDLPASYKRPAPYPLAPAAPTVKKPSLSSDTPATQPANTGNAPPGFRF